MGSSNSCPVRRFVHRHILGKVSCDHHVWTSHFGLEHALVYTARDTKPEICTICYSESECHCMVIFTLYDAMCGENAVAVNIEFVAVRDGCNGHFKFGAIKAKEFGENFVKRRQGSIGPEVLFLRYEMGGRTNELALHRVQGDKYEGYEIVFDSESLSVLPHYSVRIFCDPLRGLVTYPVNQTSRQSLCVVNVHDAPPRDEVMKVIKDIRSKMKEDAATATSHVNNIINYINNNGLVQGDHNGCINNT